MAGSSSASSQEIKYDVFISFRGKDVRNNFLGHLDDALRRKSIKTFVDNQLKRGDDISFSLLNTIKASKISVIIFSERYADSKWCLQELEQILDCKRTRGQIVIPIFYKIDPSNVRRQSGSFGAGFVELEKHLTKRSYDLEGLKNLKVDLERWKAALEEAANLSGHTVNDNKPEIILINEAVEDILKKLNKISTHDNMDLVGAESSIQKVGSLLRVGSNGVRVTGIWGIGGIGKTKIGRAVFNKILNQFECSYFAEDVREKSERCIEQNSLRQEILFKVLGDRDADINHQYTIERLGRKKVLLAFDDLTSYEQIEKLIGDFQNLGSGSRIIITTRDKQVLRACGLGDDDIYEVKGLSDSNALQLFGWCAFRKHCPIDEDFAYLSSKMVLYTKGVPLALKLLGSSLRGEPKNVWESEWNNLQQHPNLGIQRVLRRSYEGLESYNQSIFLDITCFFKGWKTYFVEDILNARGLTNFIDKSLVSISHDNTIGMHDLIQEMGRYIVREESHHYPGQRSRLWDPDDISKLFKKNTGTPKVQGIFFDTSTVSQLVPLKGDAFAKMRNLRLLKVYDRLSAFLTSTENKFIGVERLESLPRGLTYFHWEAYPSRSLPSDFFAEDLVRLDMRSSKLEQLWDDVQDLKKLKYVNLSDSTRLKKLPDLSKAEKLQVLILNGCTSLENIDSIQYLNDLVRLDMRNSKLEQLWDDVQHLKKLKYLNLSDSTRLKKIPDLSKAKKLQELFLNGCTSLENIDSIQYLNDLVNLDLSKCDSLSIVPDCTIQSTFVSFRGCSNLMVAPKISCKVEKLDLSGTAIKESPFIEYPSTSRLTGLDLSDCSKLESLSSSICKCILLKYLNVNACPKLKGLPNDLGNLEELVILEISGSNLIELPPSITKLSNLRSLCFSRRMDQEPLSWSPTPLSGFKFLETLKLANRGITMLPDDLGQFRILHLLDLSRNNFQSMPAMNNVFPILNKLDISYCESLTSLPELPGPLILKANNCSSLTTVSNLQCLEFREFEDTVNFANCFKLNLLEMIHKESHPAAYQRLCYPGHEIPNWFRWRNEGSSISLDRPPYFYKKRILVLMMAAVVAFPERTCINPIEVICSFLIKWGDGKFDLCEHDMSAWLGDGCYIESDHIILSFYEGVVETEPICIRCLNDKIQIGELGDSEVLIKFSAGDFDVKQCGLHVRLGQEEEDKPHWGSLFYCPDVDTDEEDEDDVDTDKGKDCMLHSNNENEEGEEPQPKRLKIFNSSNAESSSRNLDDENEEGEESQPKRSKICNPSSIRFCAWCDDEC